MTNASLIDRNVPTVGINGFGRIGTYSVSSIPDMLIHRASCPTPLPRKERPPSGSHQPYRSFPRTPHDGHPPRFDSWSMSSICRNCPRTFRPPRSPRPNSQQSHSFRPALPRPTDSSIFSEGSKICRLGIGRSGIRDGINGEDDDARNGQCAYHPWRSKEGPYFGAE